MTNGADELKDLDVLAGEYVLGLMSESDRDDFEQRLRAEEAVRAALASAQDRLLELDATAPPSAPPDDMWNRIEAGLGQASAQVIDARERLGQPGKAARHSGPASRSPRVSFWQGFAAASLAAVIAGALALTVLAPDRPRLIIVLLDSDAKPVSIVEAFDGQQIRVVPLTNFNVPTGKTLQVWTLPDQTTGPVSMGLMPSPGATTLQGPSLPAPKPEQLYEITLEPAGGSPTGRPTGPILGKGYARIPQI
jgi:anti-sigma-K factor RskA